MESEAGKDVRTLSRLRAWMRTIAATVSLVVLIQVFLLLARRLAPAASARYFLVTTEITAIALAEVIVLIGVRWLLSRDKLSFGAPGLWHGGAFWAWFLGVGLGLLTAFYGLSNPALHLPSKLEAVLDPAPWHIYSALVAGIAAGFCEEIIFRGFVMRDLAAAGYAVWVQVVGSSFLFGMAHAGLLQAGWRAGLPVIVPTAVLGAVYCLIYLLGKRSLLPVVLSHFLNDFAVIPWVFLAVVSKGH
jgi:membrane protease YdiL (CAAX protease family)